MSRPRWFVAALGALALAAAAVPAFAQRTTGTLSGTVSDNSGAVLPGVTVELTGPTVVGTQTSVTNERGLYRFPALPPGTYDLEFKMAGFTNLHQHEIRVPVGGSVEQNAALKISAMQEQVTVTAETPVVDTQGTTVSTNYDKDWVRNAPVRRFTFFDLINAAPGVSANTSTSSRSTSLGSSSDENSYQLDGTDFTAPLTGAAWPWPNTDAIEEIEVLSLGAPAEYGNLQGAVFNVVTRQGSNEFHGDANFYLQTDGLTGRNTTDAQDDGLPYRRDKFHDFSAQLSGPVVKDKLWFFGSYQYQRDADSQPGTDPAFPARSSADRVFFKANYQMNQKNKLMFAIHDDIYRIPVRATANTAPSTINEEHGHNPSPNVTFTSVLSDKTYIEARYSGFYGKDHADPLNGGPRVAPRFYNLDTGAITGGTYYWYDGESWKTGFAGKISHFADNFLGGSHDFKFGVQYNSGGSDYATGYNDLVYTYSSGGVQYGYGYTYIPRHDGGQMRAIGVFADDAFQVSPRLTLNLGVRFDNSRASIRAYPVLDKQGNPTGQSSPALDNIYTWNSVSPRFGFNAKLTEDGKTVLKGHYGRYYRGIVTGEFSSVGPSITPVFSGIWNFATNQFEDLSLVSDNTNRQVDPSFKSPYTDQFIVGFEREIVKDVGLSVNYVHKRSHDYGAWQDVGGQYVDATYVDNQGADATGQSITVKRLISDQADRLFVLTNPSGMQTRINALTVQLQKRMSNHWQFVTSFVYSKSEGRIASSLSSLTTAQTGNAGNDFGQNPNDYINTDGRLIGDRPVTFKTQLVWEAPKGFMVAANFQHQSGRPWARQVRVSGVTDFTTTINAERIDGSRRVADWNLLDVRIQKQFGLGGTANLALFGDALNLTNSDAYESVLSRLGTTDTFGAPSRFIFPRRLMVGAKIRF